MVSLTFCCAVQVNNETDGTGLDGVVKMMIRDLIANY